MQPPSLRLLFRPQTDYWENEWPPGPEEVKGYVVDNGHSSGAVPMPLSHLEPRDVPGYTIQRDTDAAGADLPGANNPVRSKDPFMIAEQCNADPNCRGFNSNGYMKMDTTKTGHEYGCHLYVKTKVD